MVFCRLIQQTFARNTVKRYVQLVKVNMSIRDEKKTFFSKKQPTWFFKKYALLFF